MKVADVIRELSKLDPESKVEIDTGDDPASILRIEIGEWTLDTGNKKKKVCFVTDAHKRKGERDPHTYFGVRGTLRWRKERTPKVILQSFKD